MDVEELVVGEGDLATASGRLVRNHAGDWLEPPVWIAGVGGGHGTIRPVAPSAIRIAAADFNELARRFEDDNGTVEGFATVTGTWSAGQLHVQHQAAPGRNSLRFPRHVTPPCAPPAGGWPRHGNPVHFDMAELPRATVVAVTVFRPGQDQEVLVVAATDPDEARAWLRPRFGDRLCVVASRWTTAELNEVRAYVEARARAWKLSQVGQSTSEDGQACVDVRLTRVLPEIASWVSGLPDGIVSLDPWLQPVHGRGDVS